MSSPRLSTRELLTRMLSKVEEMHRVLDDADALDAVDSGRARELLDDLERRVRAMIDDATDDRTV